jgi:hypothetical protein
MLSPEQLAPLLAWVAAKYAEELDARFLTMPVEDLWGRHVIWLFLLMKPKGVDPQDAGAIAAFLDTLPDEVMAQARQMFFQVITERQAIGGTPLGSVKA